MVLPTAPTRLPGPTGPGGIGLTRPVPCQADPSRPELFLGGLCDPGWQRPGQTGAVVGPLIVRARIREGGGRIAAPAGLL
jgi:hypothetical protein